MIYTCSLVRTDSVLTKLHSCSHCKSKEKQRIGEAECLNGNLRLQIGFCHHRIAGTDPRAEAGGPPSCTTWHVRHMWWQRKWLQRSQGQQLLPWWWFQSEWRLDLEREKGMIITLQRQCYKTAKKKKKCQYFKMYTWPFSFIRVAKIFRGGHKHICISNRGPERHHVVAPVMTNGCVFFWIHSWICQEIFDFRLKANHANNKAVKQMQVLYS